MSALKLASSLVRPASSLRSFAPKVNGSFLLKPKFFATQNSFRPLTQPSSVRVRHPAPAFVADAVSADGSFTKINFPADYKGKYVVLFFYPLDFTFVCPTEIIEFSDRANEFRDVNCEVVGISVDSKFSHLAFTETPRNKGGLGKLNIPLISDLSQTISEQYGVLEPEAMHSFRGTVILDGHGKVRNVSIGDFPVGRNVDEVLRLVKGYQYSDKHGEVCPSGWKPGDATIVTNPKDKLKYFEKKNKH